MLIASFDDDEIGSRMTTNCIVIRENLTVKEAMRSLVKQAAENDNISKIYVADESNTFCGAIDLKDLIIAREGTRLDDMIVTSYPYVYGHESISECIEILKDYSEDSIPVLDNNNKILGVITAQNIIEVVDEEMGEDYARLAGLMAEEDLKEPLLDSMKKRLPWLVVLMFLNDSFICCRHIRVSSLTADNFNDVSVSHSWYVRKCRNAVTGSYSSCFNG